MKRIPVVDIFRGIAILLTLAIHLGPSYITANYPQVILDQAWFKLWSAGGYGVSMFFLLSGYIITRRIADRPGGLFEPDFADFYARRVGRILPLLMLVCALGALAVHTLPPGPALSARALYCLRNPAAPLTWLFWVSIAFFFFNWYRTFLGWHIASFGINWDLLWSLSIEEQFYAFYPRLLRRLGGERNLVLFLVFLILLSPAVNTLAYGTYPRWHTWNSFAYFGLMAYGCLLFLAERAVGEHLSRRPGLCWSLCALGSALMAWILLHSAARIFVWLGLWGSTILDLGLFLFLLGGLRLDFFGSKWWRPLTFPGELSYGMYLYHLLVLYFLWPWLSGMDHFRAYFLFGLATTALAWLSFVCYERPLNPRFRGWFLLLYRRWSGGHAGGPN